MGGNGIYLPSVVRPYQSSIKSKKDSFPYGCCPFSYALLLFISGFENLLQSEPSPGMDWRSPPSENTLHGGANFTLSTAAVTADTLPLTKNQGMSAALCILCFIKKLLQSLTSDPVPETAFASPRTSTSPNAPYVILISPYFVIVIAIAVSVSSDGDAITVCETTFAIGSAVRIATSIAAFTSEILPRIFTQAPAPRRFLSTP